MSLRLRRGTDAERLLITPAEGELIYTTDTKRVYIGDGVTPGGLRYEISGLALNDLDDVSIIQGDSTDPTDGDSLLFDSDSGEWRPGVPQPSGTLGSNIDLNSFDITGTGNLNVTGSITATGVTGSDTLNTQSIVIDRIDDTIGDYLEINTTVASNNFGSSIEFNTTNVVGGVDTAVPPNSLLGRFKFTGFDGVGYTEAVDIAARTTSASSEGVVPGLLTITTFSGTQSNNFFFGPGGEFIAPIIQSNSATLKGNFTGSVFSDDSTQIVDGINGKIIAQVQLTGSVPSTSSDAGSVGELRFDDDYLYIYTSENAWRRVALDKTSF